MTFTSVLSSVHDQTRFRGDWCIDTEAGKVVLFLSAAAVGIPAQDQDLRLTLSMHSWAWETARKFSSLPLFQL